MSDDDAQPPAWWVPYASEFPDWHAWTGVAGLLYARLPRSSPPVVVRATDAAGVAAAIRAWYRQRALSRRHSTWLER